MRAVVVTSRLSKRSEWQYKQVMKRQYGIWTVLESPLRILEPEMQATPQREDVENERLEYSSCSHLA